MQLVPSSDFSGLCRDGLCLMLKSVTRKLLCSLGIKARASVLLAKLHSALRSDFDSSQQTEVSGSSCHNMIWKTSLVNSFLHCLRVHVGSFGSLPVSTKGGSGILPCPHLPLHQYSSSTAILGMISIYSALSFQNPTCEVQPKPLLLLFCPLAYPVLFPVPSLWPREGRSRRTNIICTSSF